MPYPPEKVDVAEHFGPQLDNPLKQFVLQQATQRSHEGTKKALRGGQFAEVVDAFEGNSTEALAMSNTFVEFAKDSKELLRWHSSGVYDWEQDSVIRCRWKTGAGADFTALAQVGFEDWPVADTDLRPVGLVDNIVVGASVADGAQWQEFTIDMSSLSIPQPAGSAPALPTYWVRMFLAHQDGRVTVSESRLLKWGHIAREPWIPIVLGDPTVLPTVRLVHYDPIRHYRSGDENCFLATADLFVGGIEKGHVYCGPKGEPDWLDDAWAAISSVGEWLVDAYDWLAAKFNETMGDAIAWLVDKTGLDAEEIGKQLRKLFATFDIPLGLPSSAEAIQMGEDYLSIYLATQMGSPMLAPIIRKGLEAYRQALVDVYRGGGGSSERRLLVPDPGHQEHGAMITIEIVNLADDDSHSGTFDLTFEQPVFFDVRSISVPPMTAGQSYLLSIFLRPNLLLGYDHLYGLVDDRMVQDYWRDRYNAPLKLGTNGPVHNGLPATLMPSVAIDPLLAV